MLKTVSLTAAFHGKKEKTEAVNGGHNVLCISERATDKGIGVIIRKSNSAEKRRTVDEDINRLGQRKKPLFENIHVYIIEKQKQNQRPDAITDY